MKTKAKRTKAAAGKQGGTARAKRMSAEERSRSARRAAQARWWTPKQEILRRYPQAFCFQLQDVDHDAYQVSTPIILNNGVRFNEPLTGVWSSPRLAWKKAWEEEVRTKGQRR